MLHFTHFLVCSTTLKETSSHSLADRPFDSFFEVLGISLLRAHPALLLGDGLGLAVQQLQKLVAQLFVLLLLFFN